MTANASRLSIRIAAALFATLALATDAWAAAAGKILFVAGPVTLERTPAVTLKAGDAIATGDVIVTGDKARAQLLMNDGARVALRASSRYRIDEFGLPAAVGAPTQATATKADGISVATLLKGGYRASTGAIGKDGTGTYEVRTPIGTLGIRGTDYTAVWCQGDCADVPGLAPSDAARNGMYLATHLGAIVFRYGTREVVVNAGETIFIAAATADPEPLERVPRWLLEDGAGPLVTGERDDKAGTVALPDFSDRRQPVTGQQPPGDTGVDPSDPNKASDTQRPITGTFGGQNIDLTSGQLPRGQSNPGPTPSVPPPTNQPPPNQPPAGTAAPPPSNNVPPPPPNVPPPTGGN